MNDVDGETIKSAVEFCYTGIIELTEENVEKCLKIAASGEIDLLEAKCRQFYSTKLSVENSVDVLIIADQYRFMDLQQHAFDLICEKFDTVPAKDIQKLSHRLLLELLQNEKIQQFGDFCANRLLEWFQWDEDERAVFMPESLKLLRLEQLSVEVCSEYILSNTR